MIRKKYTPTKETLKQAWALREAGLSISEILKDLKITKSQYNSKKLMFKNFFSRKRVESQNDYLLKNVLQPDNLARPFKKNNLGNEKKHVRGKQMELTDMNLTALRAYVLTGWTKDKIAKVLGISTQTLRKYANTFPIIKEILDTELEKATSQVIESLLKVSNGYRVKARYFAVNDGKIISEEYMKHIGPSVSGQKYWLTNTEQWRNEPNASSVNNKGSILKALDHMNLDEEVEDE